jgi:hypothetical protein
VRLPAVNVVKDLLRRPLLLLLVLGCVVSMEASGRFSLRLIADGMISFAFVPVAEVGSLALVWRWNGRPVPFARAVDLFCQSNSPWLFWMVAVAALRAIESPLQAVSTPAAVWYVAAATLAGVAVRAAQLDLRLFRDVLAPARPVRALAVQRLVAWSCALGYFFGIALWPNVVGFVRG